MGHLLYLMFRCDFNVMESLESLEEFGGSEVLPPLLVHKRAVEGALESVVNERHERHQQRET